jgi:hypothetical protein
MYPDVLTATLLTLPPGIRATVIIVPFGFTSRIRLLPESPIYNWPADPSATDTGSDSSASTAGPPSPANPALPSPATVLIFPLADTSRTRLFPESAMKTDPFFEMAIPHGRSSSASIAGAPSPPKPRLPLPAKTRNCPLGSRSRTSSRPWSDTSRYPFLSTATASGRTILISGFSAGCRPALLRRLDWLLCATLFPITLVLSAFPGDEVPTNIPTPMAATTMHAAVVA